MDKTKQTLVIALAAVLVVVAGGWFLLISPQRSQVASLNSETATVDTTNASLQTKLDQLRSESTQRTGQVAILAAIAKRLPADLQEANLLDDLSHAADAANVDLSGITPAQPVLASAAAPAAAPVTAGSTAAKAAVPNQLYAVPLGLTVSGNYFDLEMFVHSLEGMQRAMLITALNFSKASVTAGAPASAGTTSAGTTAGTTNGASTGGTGSTATSGTSGKTSATGGKGSTTTVTKGGSKPVPGSPGAAQAELNKLTTVAQDENTLSLTITGEVFSMYSPAVAAAAATPTPAPTTTN